MHAMADTQPLQEILETVLTLFKEREQCSETTMTLWFSDVSLTMLTDNMAVLVSKRDFKRDIIRKQYREKLEDIFAEVLGFRIELDIRSSEVHPKDPDMAGFPPGTRDSESRQRADTPPAFPGRDKPAKAPAESEPGYYTTAQDKESFDQQKIQKEYTFENFIVGNSNKFAHAACRAVAANPAREYNPLFIYGPSGLGKTHLLYAITGELKRTKPELVSVYVKGETFTNQMIDSISKNNTAAFREIYRKADILLIDDIQFIAGREATQEEFFHTFNELYENRKQIVLTSDRPPHDIKSLEERLETRFEWGLIADIKPPDYELRTAILKKKAESLGIRLPDDVLNYIAENLKNNVRQLEGAVRKVGAQSFLAGEPISLELTKACIADLITPSEPIHVTVDKILTNVSRHYSVSVEDLKGKKRTQDIAMARHISIYIIRTMTEMSLPAIGKVFNRDHTTIINSLEKVETEIKANPTLDIEIKALLKEIKE